jgi:hypothetical protein
VIGRAAAILALIPDGDDRQIQLVHHT